MYILKTNLFTHIQLKEKNSRSSFLFGKISVSIKTELVQSSGRNESKFFKQLGLISMRLVYYVFPELKNKNTAGTRMEIIVRKSSVMYIFISF